MTTTTKVMIMLKIIIVVNHHIIITVMMRVNYKTVAVLGLRYNTVQYNTPWNTTRQCLMKNIELWAHQRQLIAPLLWRHNGRNGVSNHQPHDCLLNRPSRPRSKKTSKLRITALWAGNSPVTDEFPAQMASNAENVPIWLRHHAPVSGLALMDAPYGVYCEYFELIWPC